MVRPANEFVVRCLAMALALGLGVSPSGCSDSTGPSGGCEVAYQLGANVDGRTRIEIADETSGHVLAFVGHPSFTDTAANLEPGECVAWSLFGGTFQVSVYRCGDSDCDNTIGNPVVQSVTVAAGGSVKVRVAPNLFQ